jgi:hypothetical protein
VNEKRDILSNIREHHVHPQDFDTETRIHFWTWKIPLGDVEVVSTNHYFWHDIVR